MLYSIVVMIAASGFVQLQAALVQHVAFDFADVTAKVRTENGEMQLEAFRVLNLNENGNGNECRRHPLPLLERHSQSQLQWVSVGNPTLLKLSNRNDTSAVFSKRPDGFHIMV